MTSERGSVAVLACVLAALAAALALGVARVGIAGAVRARAQLAADAAVLAAVGALAVGALPAEAADVAAKVAQENGARLRTCRCDGTFALVEVVAPLGRIPVLGSSFNASARAELRPQCPG